MPKSVSIMRFQIPNEPHLNRLQEKEKQSYIALSAVIDFINGCQKHTHDFKAHMDFAEYKQQVLAQVEKLKFQGPFSNSSYGENQFNVMHYQRVILSASKSNSRNMAIMAALHNLTPAALKRLVTSIKNSCIQLSKELNGSEYYH